jgi:phosphatidylinositol alpha-1,6-mannosyltransferase
MKSVLISSTYFPPQVGGISHYMACIAKTLRGEVCCLTGARAAPTAFDDSAVAVYRRPNAFSGPLSRQRAAMGMALVEIYLRERPKLIQLATVYDGYVALRLQRWLGTPYVIYAHGNEILDATSASDGKLRLILRRASRVLANSHFTAKLAADAGCEPDRIAVLHPGCDPERFKPVTPPASFREQVLGSRSGRRVILTIANLVPRKGHDMVIRALPAVLRAAPDVVYLIVGDGPHRGELKRLASACGVADSVIFAGRLPNGSLVELYAICDVFVMPSRMALEACDVEGFGMVFLEAAACAKPVIAGSSGGIPDAVEDHITGVLVDPMSAEAIGANLVRLLQSPDEARRMGEAGRARVLREFTWDRFGHELRAELVGALSETRE